MAWHYGTYACGCEGRTNVVGPAKNRQWIADRRFEEKCEECIGKERLELAEKLKETQAKLELPTLIGSDAQVNWAVQIRQKAIDKIDDPEFLNSLLEAKTKASWWIDNRFADLDKIKKEIQVDAEQAAGRTVEKDIDEESTVHPENEITNAPVKIVQKENRIELYFEKNDKFRNVVKSNLYSWDNNSKCWYRKLSKFTGNTEDRMAEIGNKLLLEGFPVIIHDPETRGNAINGTYDHECMCWITHNTGKDCFGITWRKGDWYDKAKSLPGAKWSNPNVLVNRKHYKAIIDFANENNFCLSAGAQQVIDEERKLDETRLFEKVSKKEELNKEKKETSFEVLNDLKD